MLLLSRHLDSCPAAALALLLSRHLDCCPATQLRTDRD